MVGLWCLMPLSTIEGKIYYTCLKHSAKMSIFKNNFLPKIKEIITFKE
jgi:hypothetical protein